MQIDIIGEVAVDHFSAKHSTCIVGMIWLTGLKLKLTFGLMPKLLFAIFRLARICPKLVRECSNLFVGGIHPLFST
jgi:hypothetical protein